MKDADGGRFGFYAGSAWGGAAPGSGEGTYYGTGDAFVFSLHPEFHGYRWTRRNRLFQLSAGEACLAVGGGGNFAVHLDRNLCRGVSGACATFGSPSLSAGKEDAFVVVEMEVWGFVMA